MSGHFTAGETISASEKGQLLPPGRVPVYKGRAMKRTRPETLDFRKWRDRLGLTQDEAALALGRTKRMVRNYEVGDLPVPRVVTLAMVALEEHPELCRPAGSAEP